jgi:hypothetical protein
MKEQSQIEAMRAAVRGDLERSRQRQDSSGEPEPELEHVPEAPVEDEPRPGIFASLFKRV